MYRVVRDVAPRLPAAFALLAGLAPVSALAGSPLRLDAPPGVTTGSAMLAGPAPVLSRHGAQQRWSVRADDQDAAPTTPEPTSTSTATVPGTKKDLQFEVGFRGRSLSLPGSVMDIWYYNEKDPGWALPGEPRPRISGYAGGVEFLVKGESANGIFYFEYVKSTMDEGYWDDVEGEPNHIDGEYIRPSDNLGLAVLGANYAYEAHLVKSASTKGKFAWSILVGGGLGVAYRTGTVERWVANGDCGGVTEGVDDPSYKVYQQGDPSCGPARFPPRVVPMVDVSAGTRFTFGDRVVIRVEGGLHTLVYWGAAAGLMF